MGQARHARRILVIEKDRSVRELFLDLLAGEGHEVRAAADPAHGLALADEFRPHLIFLDLWLPAVDGRPFLDRYRAEHRGDAAVIAMATAVFDRHIVPGADGVLTKPFTLEEVLRAIQTMRGEDHGTA